MALNIKIQVGICFVQSQKSFIANQKEMKNNNRLTYMLITWLEWDSQMAKGI